MMKLMAMVACVSVGIFGCASRTSSDGASDARPSVDYGEPSKGAEAPVVPVGTLLERAADYDGKFVRVAGRVSSVCEKKGCWLAMGEEQDRSLMVRFTCPIEGRLVPIEAVGKEALVEGTVKVVEVSEAEARHLKEDAGASAEEIARIVGPQRRVTIAAPSARVYGVSAER